ncbi:hypothetical protein Pint_29011 [Pistacia integerrima]|uniref:Uncharacterized protein n=1 Tax=Pistacia integerrima TaxID=434235 RepID=A0ACC0X0P8_9ROSI|nr:hypothetical protein Pint_29011 [Pistacia integerrima]
MNNSATIFITFSTVYDSPSKRIFITFSLCFFTSTRAFL